MRTAVLVLSALLLGAGSARAQNVAVFLDCQTHGCDSDHFRSEIRFIDWVRERTVADVHLLITSQGAGGGGSAYQLSFIGLRAFAGDSTTITFDVAQHLTDSERRDALTNRIAQGLLRYVGRTTAANRIRVVFDQDDEEEGARLAPGARDPWNFWVFSSRFGASIDGEAKQSSQEFELSLNANRVTEAWKVELEADGSYEEDRYELTNRTATNLRRDYSANGLLVKTIAPQWSAGMGFETGSSTYQNQDFYARVAAALEYSFFPYEQFSRRRVVLQYLVGVRHFDYEELTIYDQLSERRADQSLELSLNFQQPWGSAYSSLRGSHYLHDLKRYNLSVNGGLEVRLFRGFSFDVNGHYSRVHDQLHIAKGDEDPDDILLRRKELETNYRYSTEIGLRYTFGSVFNNIVNPRFR